MLLVYIYILVYTISIYYEYIKYITYTTYIVIIIIFIVCCVCVGSLFLGYCKLSVLYTNYLLFPLNFYIIALTKCKQTPKCLLDISGIGPDKRRRNTLKR